MGCDIHFVVERRTDEGKWIGVYSTCVTPRMMTVGEDKEAPFDFKIDYGRTAAMKQRDYAFFNALAGVRGDSASGARPVGLPPDPSELTQHALERWSGDGHSHSWLPYRDFCGRYALRHALTFTDNGNLARVSGLSDYEEEEYDQLRVVFWFDN